MTLRNFLHVTYKEMAVDEQLTPFLRKEINQLRLNEAYQVAEFIGMDPVELIIDMMWRRCRVCGCTDEDCSQCIEKTGSPCHWIGLELCSACV